MTNIGVSFYNILKVELYLVKWILGKIMPESAILEIMKMHTGALSGRQRDAWLWREGRCTPPFSSS